MRAQRVAHLQKLSSVHALLPLALGSMIARIESKEAK
jgi:hypothetical protein